MLATNPKRHARRWLQGDRVAGEEPVLQGPFGMRKPEGNTNGDDDDDLFDEVVCDLRVGSSKLPTIATLYESGLFEVRLLLASVGPAWRAAKKKSIEDTLVLLDRVDTGANAHTLRPDILRPSAWFVSHQGGVDYVWIPKFGPVVERLIAMLKDDANSTTANAGAASEDLLLRAETAPLLQSDFSHDGMAGSCAVVSTKGEHVLCYYAHSAKRFSVLDLMDASGGGSGSTGDADANMSVEDAAVVGADLTTVRKEPAWKLELAEWDRSRPKPVPRVEFREKTSRVDQLQIAVQLAELYSRHGVHLVNGSEIVRAGAADWKMRKEEVKALLDRAARSLDAVGNRSDVLRERLRVVQTNDENLRKRVALLSSLVTQLQPTLSDAEREYFSMLQRKLKELQSMETAVDRLERFVEETNRTSSLTTSDDRFRDEIDAEKLEVIQTYLLDQEKTIERLLNLCGK